MKKILFINSVCSVGSTGRIVKDLYDAAIKQGHICKIAYGRGDAMGVPEKDAYCIGTRLSLYLTAFRARLNDREGFMLRAQTKRFLKFVDDFAPDVIHIHNIHGYFLNIPLLFQYIGDHPEIKVIWTLHDCWSFTGHCAVFDNTPCDRWKSGCHSCPRRKTYPASLLADCSSRNYIEKKKYLCMPKDMTVVTPSEWLGEIVSQSFLSKYPVKVIRNGIDTSLFAPDTSDIRNKYGLEDKCVLLALSLKWYPSKGTDDLVRLRKLLPDDYVIVAIGEGSDSYFDGEGFITLSRTNDRSELAQWYTAADYLVNPTHADNFPTVNLEALACGTPVITYNTGGSPEAINEKCGAVIFDSTPESLAKTVMSRPHFLSSDCIEHSKNFDKSNALKGYLELYAEH